MDFSQSIDREQLREIFRSPFRPKIWESLLVDVFKANNLYKKPKRIEIKNGENGKVVVGYNLGEILTCDGYKIGLYRFEIKAGYNIPMNKAGLRGFVEKDIKYFYDAALVVFYNETQWRLSYICYLQEGKTASKRFTYVFGDPAQTYRTPISRFEFIKAEGPSRSVIHEAFSVESLGKDFFDGYKRQYRIFCDNIGGGEKWERDYVKKLLGRLVFLQFLQKKGWMGVPAAASGWEGGDPNFMSKLIDRYEGRKDILSYVLEPLFFDTLNTRREGDIADPRLGENIKIPYLNGGLFDRSELDREHRVDFPCALFKGLMDFFISYNFTIDENDPDDIDVGIDPEMLGHIFENLLEDNKDKGTYYTPKEIVQYMSCESIRQYLHNNTSPECHAWVDKLVLKNESDGLPRSVGLNIQSRLKEVKVCDPAIGSGAFPMGILSVIYRCRLKLYGANISSETFSPAAIKRQIIRNNIYGVDIEQGAVDIARLRFWLSLVVDEEQPEPLPNLDFKIMQGNSLLESFEGVDLSKFTDAPHTGADMLGSLFDAQTREAIEPLIQHHFSVTDHAEKESIRERIDAIIRQHIEDSLDRRERELTRERDFHAKAVASNREFIDNPATPAANRRKYEKSLRTELLQLRRAERNLEKIAASREHIKHVDRNNMPFFLWHVYFKDVFDRGGFDIVIGNPPYIKEYTNKKAFDGFREISDYYMGKMDIWYGFACFGLDILKTTTGVLTFIATNNWTTNYGADILREKIRTQAKILNLIDFGSYKIFENAGIQTMVMLFSADASEKEYSFDMRKLSGANASLEDVKGILERNHQVEAEYFIPKFVRDNFIGKTFNFQPEIKEQLLDKIEKSAVHLTKDEVKQGIVYPQDRLNAANQKILGASYVRGEGIFVLKREEIEKLNLTHEEKLLLRPCYTTQQIHRYVTLKDTEESIIYTDSSFKKPDSMDSYPNLKKHLDRFSPILTSENKPYGLNRSREEVYFKGEKIIALRKSVDKPIFSYADFDTYFSQTFYSIKTERFDYKYLLGFLNSSLVKFWLKNRGKMQGDNYQLDKEPLCKLPIRIPDNVKEKEIVNLVDKIIEEKTYSISNDTSDLEKKIDQIIYSFYDLTEEEICQIENMDKIFKPKVTSTGKEYDFFISHASEDKEAVVRKLAEDLRSAGFKVWYDEFELHIGDSLRKKIDYGLSNSSYGLVILSKNFFNKNWTEYELNGMIAREENGQRVVLPVWHGITKKDVLKFSPSLADKMALNTATHSNEEIIEKLKAMIERDKNCTS